MYKCIICGSIEELAVDRPGISCRSCGSRIFAKPRRSGHKVIDAN
ncbi:MAG TPA: DNA-directed RNA polymerase subunit P [Candidatus Poseidoniales archaeon]|nr:DNA-directed RNA polymerase subunit P [Euryarchaeota archaeon]MBT6644823.1 DNA-directed RNA polymerase subunit P [Euryarchaeota archaeon]RZD44879.1 MAG: DNA-directed RNA polymerase subunit P [Euryarchaeota archaeon]HIG03463.1 DNA-directed RNA polymerase subunit P [Candidatus Poseidoniales archaeon]HIK78415.1 DNA-directed RNA polymerase subunit P [Candidatus Poseidoniales archaeon]